MAGALNIQDANTVQEVHNRVNKFFAEVLKKLSTENPKLDPKTAKYFSHPSLMRDNIYFTRKAVEKKVAAINLGAMDYYTHPAGVDDAKDIEDDDVGIVIEKNILKDMRGWSIKDVNTEQYFFTSEQLKELEPYDPDSYDDADGHLPKGAVRIPIEPLGMGSHNLIASPNGSFALGCKTFTLSVMQDVKKRRRWFSSQFGQTKYDEKIPAKPDFDNVNYHTLIRERTLKIRYEAFTAAVPHLEAIQARISKKSGRKKVAKKAGRK